MCNNPKFCYVKKIDTPEGVQNAIAIKGKQWEVGQTIYYYFDGGTVEEKAAVYFVIEELMTIANIKFVETIDRQTSDVRIAFEKGIGSWSYLGTDCLFISKSEATMNFGWDITNDLGTIRHEWLHLMSLTHEHQHSTDPVQWNKEQVISDMTAVGWTLEDIQHNIFDTVDKDDTVLMSEQRDKESIMHYFFPSSWVLDGELIPQNFDYSETDIKALQELYPFPQQPEEPIIDDETDVDDEVVVTEPELGDVLLDALKIVYGSKKIKRLYVREHKQVATLFGLSTTGRENDIIERIKEHLNSL